MAKTPSDSTAVAVVPTSTSIELKAVNGHGWATSLQVGERFGKRHKDVLRAINGLGCSEAFMQRNFAPHEYLDGRKNTQPYFEMTRDGFSILAMGFTGPEAMAWKESFIAAFNQLEQAYIEQIQIKAQAAIEARDNQLFLKTAKWKDEVAHRNMGETLIRKIKGEPDQHLRRHYYNTLSSLYRRLGDEPPAYKEMVSELPLIGNGPVALEGGAA